MCLITDAVIQSNTRRPRKFLNFPIVRNHYQDIKRLTTASLDALKNFLRLTFNPN